MIKLSIEEMVDNTINILESSKKKRALLQNYIFGDLNSYLNLFRKKIDGKRKIKIIDYTNNLPYSKFSALQLHNRLSYEEKRSKNRISIILDPLSRLEDDFKASCYTINFGECRDY